MSETVSTEVTLEEKTVKADKSSENKSRDKKQKGGRFAALKAEFKKIVWPERASVVRNTTAVVLVSIFIGIAVKVSDLLIQALLDLLL